MAGSQQSTKANRATKTGKTHQVPIRIHEDVELTLQNPKGKPVPDWHYVVKDVDGEIHEGKLDANGHAKVRVPRGKCIVKLTPEPPRKESRPAPEPPADPRTDRPKATEGIASKKRKKTLKDVIDASKKGDSGDAGNG